jgi:hypothetical protein
MRKHLQVQTRGSDVINMKQKRLEDWTDIKRKASCSSCCLYFARGHFRCFNGIDSVGLERKREIALVCHNCDMSTATN